MKWPPPKQSSPVIPFASLFGFAASRIAIVSRRVSLRVARLT